MAEVDEKVVSMRFDNRQFEQGVSQSLQSLEKLKSSLNLDQSTKSLQALENKVSKFDASGINKAADAASKAFSSLGAVGFSVINRLTNDMVNLGRSVVANVTKPIREGVQTYEQMITATQTTMNALNLTGRQGEQQVKTYLKDLNKYSDETIYRFSDMTTSLSKFVSAGVDINDATQAIKGLGNVAALSGANTMQFSRAIYNISQSLGMGKLITRDWMSIENANMATKEFKETLIDTAKEMGYINKTGQLTKKGLAGVSAAQQKQMAAMTITYKNFRDSLSGGWLKNDVLMAALKRYADETDELGKKGKAAATEVKTFSQLIDTLGDALATKWSNIYSIVVGDFNDAKEFWTKVNGVLEDILVKPLERLDKVLERWNDVYNGRTSILQTLQIQLEGLKTLFGAIKEGWETVFPQKNQVQGLRSITDQFREFSYNVAHFLIVLAKPAAHIAILVATITKIIATAIQDLTIILAPVVRLAGNIIIAVSKVLGALGDLLFGITSTKDAASQNLTFAQKVASVLGPICDTISKGINFVADAITNLISKIRGGGEVEEEATKAANTAKKTQNALAPFLSFLKSFGKFFLNVGKLIGLAAQQLFSALDNAFSGLNKILEDSSLTPLERLFQGFTMLTSGAGMAGLVRIIQNVANAIRNFGGIADEFSGAINRIGKSISKTISSFANKNNSEALKTFSIAVAVMAGSLTLVASVKPERLAGAVGAIGLLCAMMLTMFGVMQKLTAIGQDADKAKKGIGSLLSAFAPSPVNQAAKAMIGLAIAVGIMAGSIAAIGQLDYGKMAMATGLVTGMMFALVGVTKLMSLAVKDSKGFMSAAMALTTMAMAVNMLTKSISALGQMDISDLVQGMVATGIILISMVGIIALLGAAVKKCAPQLAIFSASMLMLAPAILVISAAFAVFSAVSWDGVWRGITAIGLVMAMMIGASAIMAACKPMMAALPVLAASMLLLAPALVVLASSFAIFSAVSWDGVLRGIAAIGAVVGIFALVAGIMTKVPLMMATLPVLAASFMILAPAIVTLAAAFVIFNKVDWSAVGKGIVAIGALMAIMAVISGIMSVVPLMMAGMPILAASLALLAPAVVLIASAMVIFSQVSWGGVAKGVVTMLAFMGLTAVFGTLAIVAGPGSKAMVIMASAITIIASAMMIFSQVSWGGVAKGVTTMLAFMSFTVIFGTLAALAGPGAKATILMATAMTILATAFIGFSNVEWGGVAKGVVALLGIVGVFTALAAAIAFVPKLMLGLLGVVALLKVISVAFTALDAMNLGTLGESFTIFCKKLAEGITELAKAGKDGKKGIEEAVKALMTVAVASAGDYTNQYYATGATLMQAMAAGMLSQRAQFDIGLATVGNSLVNFASTGGQTAYTTGAYVGNQLAEGFRGPKGLDDPPEESKATNEGLETVDNSISNAQDYLGPTSYGTGSFAGLNLVQGFADGSAGIDTELNNIDAKIAAMQQRAENLNYTRNWVSSHADSIGKNVYSKNTKTGVREEWVKRGDHYDHYMNGNFVGSTNKTPKGVKANNKIKRQPATAITPTNTGTSSKKKTGSKGSKEVEAAEWGNKKGYTPDKNGIWKWSDFWKGFNAYDEAAESLSKWNKSLKKFNDTVKKVGKGINPAKPAKLMKTFAKSIIMSDDSTKQLQKNIKTNKENIKIWKEEAAQARKEATDGTRSGRRNKELLAFAKEMDGMVASEEKKLSSNQSKLNNVSKQTTDFSKSVGNAWTRYYATTPEYKEQKNSLDEYKKSTDKAQKNVKTINKRLKPAEKELKKLNSKKSLNSEEKARQQALEKFVDTLKDERKDQRDTIKKNAEEVDKITKDIHNGANKLFKESYNNISKSIRDTLKITGLYANSGESIFEHFQYNGTKKDFESGKQAWRLAGYGQTQNQYWKNLIDDRDYLLSQENLSDETKDYIMKNWKDLGNEMHAWRYASTEDSKQIDENIQQMYKNDAQAYYENFKNKYERAQKFADGLAKLAGYGLDPKLIKQIAEMGFTDESEGIVTEMLTMAQSPEGLDALKKWGTDAGKSLLLGFDGADIINSLINSETFSMMSDEDKKKYAQAMGYVWDDNTKAYILDSTKKNLTDVGKESAEEAGKVSGETFAQAFATAVSEYLTKNGIGGLDGSHGVGKQVMYLYDNIDEWAKGGSIMNPGNNKKGPEWERVTNKVMNDVDDKDAYQAGVYLIQGFLNGIMDHDHLKKLSSAAGKAGHISLDTIKEILEINSPSKATYEYGVYLIEGLINGITDSTEKIKAPAEKSAKVVLDAYNKVAQIDTATIQPTIAPVIDQDALSNAWDTVSGFMTDTTAALADQIQYQLDTNKAIQNFNTQVEYDDSDLINELESMHSDMMQLQNAISSMQITMDTGALVGQIAPEMDKTLGQRAQTTRGRR